MNNEKLEKYTPLILFGLSLIYYVTLSAKTWTWTFVSQDSGDWLASAQMWFTPQPYGSPLYIFLAKAVNIIPGDLVFNMTFFLSCIPGAVVIALTYMIAKELTRDHVISFIVGLVMLGCAILLTQSTVVEEYALSAMFIFLAFYYYIKNDKKAWLFMLACGLAVHVILGLLALVWLALEWRNRSEWLRHLWVILLVGVLPYSYLIVTMGTDTPRLIGGGLSLASINTWLGSTSTIATMSAVEAPERLIQASGVLISAFAFALIPLYTGIKNRNLDGINPQKIQLHRVCFALLLVVAFLYVTNRDYTTWTFLTFGLPCFVVFISHGLKMTSQNPKLAVFLGALMLLVLNSLFLNANQITNENPLATEYESALMSLEDNSAVITPRGCATGLGLAYVLSNGKELAPILLYPSKEKVDEVVYNDYLDWLERDYGISGDNTLELVKSALDQNRKVYFSFPVFDFWEKAFLMAPTDSPTLFQVYWVDLDPDWTEEELETYQ